MYSNDSNKLSKSGNALPFSAPQTVPPPPLTPQALGQAIGEIGQCSSRRPETLEVLEGIERSLAVQSDELGALGERLKPVMHADPAPDQETKRQYSCSCQLTSYLARLLGQIELNTAIIADFRSRLEV